MEKHYTTEKWVIQPESWGCLDSLHSATFKTHHTLHRAEKPKHILLRRSQSESIQHIRFTQQCMKWIIFLVIFKLQHWFISLGGRRLGGCSLTEKEMPTEPFITHPGSTSLGFDWMCPIAPYKLIVSNWNRFWSSEWYHIDSHTRALPPQL